MIQSLPGAQRRFFPKLDECLKMSEPYRTHIQVRFKDQDGMGHVNNAVFFTYFEIGRTAFLSEHISARIGKSSSSFIIAHITCDYIKPITLGTKITLNLYVNHIGRKSFSFLYILSDSHDTSIEYARGESVQVCYDYDNERSIDITPNLKNILVKFLFDDALSDKLSCKTIEDIKRDKIP